MLKIEITEGRVVVSGTSIFTQPHAISNLIEELQKAQQKLIEEQEKQGAADNFYELWES